MRYTRLAVLTFSLGIGCVAPAQEVPKTPRHVNPAAGREVFHQYCAVCHGLDAKGNGPAAGSIQATGK